LTILFLVWSYGTVVSPSANFVTYLVSSSDLFFSHCRLCHSRQLFRFRFPSVIMNFNQWPWTSNLTRIVSQSHFQVWYEFLLLNKFFFLQSVRGLGVCVSLLRTTCDLNIRGSTWPSWPSHSPKFKVTEAECWSRGWFDLDQGLFTFMFGVESACSVLYIVLYGVLLRFTAASCSWRRRKHHNVAGRGCWFTAGNLPSRENTKDRPDSVKLATDYSSGARIIGKQGRSGDMSTGVEVRRVVSDWHIMSIVRPSAMLNTVQTRSRHLVTAAFHCSSLLLTAHYLFRPCVNCDLLLRMYDFSLLLFYLKILHSSK